MPSYTIGLDYGTGSVRAILVSTTGEEVAAHVYDYPHGAAGVVISQRDPNLARQHPRDYETGAEAAVKGVLKEGAEKKGVRPEEIIGIGVDTTGSTPLPVDSHGVPLAYDKRFADDPNALAWLWKDHTSHAEAEEITSVGGKMHPEYLAKIGNRYSSEWFWAKILHCARVAPAVFDAAATWVEIADWIPAMLCDTLKPAQVRRGVCAAGHKAFFNAHWGGYPDVEFLKALDPRLERMRKSLPEKVFTVADQAGTLSENWAKRLGLKAGIPVAVGAFDVHLGAVGSGITPGTLVKIMGTSTCDLAIAPVSEKIADVPGICGIVDGSVLPGFFGLEAGQSAVGDIFNWFVNVIVPGGRVGSRSCEAFPESGGAQAGRIGVVGARLAQRQPHDSGRSAADRFDCGTDAALEPGRDLPSPDRGHGIRRPGDYGALRRVRLHRETDRQRRRHCSEKPRGDADLRRHYGAAHCGHTQSANLRAGCRDCRRGGGGQKGRRIR